MKQLTWEEMAEISHKHLTKAEFEVVVHACLNRTREVTAAYEHMPEKKFCTEKEVAEAMLRVCQQALRGGVS